jgi:hypothetical protein
VKTYLEIGQMPYILNLTQQKKLGRKVEPFILKEGIMYIVGQDNIMHRCLTISKPHIVLKELPEGVVGGHFGIHIIVKKILDVGY